MTRISVNGIKLEVEVSGRTDDEPVLLICGLAGQLIDWKDVFVQLLNNMGFFVIRFDNRDSGLSTHIDPTNSPKDGIPYSLSDFATDASLLLDSLGICSAHIVGASMGGMIAQVLAIEHPEKVKSLVSIMSNTGATGVGAPNNEIIGEIFVPPPESRDEVVEHELKIARLISSPGYIFDEVAERDYIIEKYERSYDPQGVVRQLMAILYAKDRTSDLRELDVPAAVIHGKADVLVNVSGGIATHEAIKNSTLHLFEGMSHDIPRELYKDIVDIIDENAKRANK